MQSQNTKVDLVIDGTSFLGLSSYGKIMVGDKAFEFYNSSNPNDYIQIPWDQIDYISASVLFKGKWINRFAIFIKSGQNLSFSSKDNKKLLRAISNYVPKDKLLRSLSFFDVVFKGIKSLFKR